MPSGADMPYGHLIICASYCHLVNTIVILMLKRAAGARKLWRGSCGEAVVVSHPPRRGCEALMPTLCEAVTARLVETLAVTLVVTLAVTFPSPLYLNKESILVVTQTRKVAPPTPLRARWHRQRPNLKQAYKC